METGAAAREPVRVGLVGAGPWAFRVHAPVLARSPHTTLTGVWARRPDVAVELAEQHGTVAETDVDALLAGCDAVAFAVPPAVQAELAVIAAGAGKAVLLEKPIAADLAGAERLADAVDRAGVASTVVLTWRYTRTVRDFLAAAPGIAPRTGLGRFISDGLLGGPFATPWRLERGPLLDLGPHVIDLLDAALGPVTAVSALGDLHGVVELALDHAGGATSEAQLCATASDTPRISDVVIEGDGGRLEVDCATAVGPATFSTLVEEFAAAVHGVPSPHAPGVQRGLHLQRILHDAEGQLTRSIPSRQPKHEERVAMSLIESAPTAVHRGEQDLPFIELGDGNHLQLLQVDLANGVWVVRNRFDPGTTLQIHQHTGPVYAFTQAGSWYYLESPAAVNTPGSYLYEPAGSVHTLHVPDSNQDLTDVWFTIHGANLNLDADGRVELVVDAHGILDFYRAMCAAQGLDDPPVVVIG